MHPHVQGSPPARARTILEILPNASGLGGAVSAAAVGSTLSPVVEWFTANSPPGHTTFGHAPPTGLVREPRSRRPAARRPRPRGAGGRCHVPGGRRQGQAGVGRGGDRLSARAQGRSDPLLLAAGDGAEEPAV